MNLFIKTSSVCMLTLLLLGFVGCGEKQPPPLAARDISGVKVDMPKLEQEFVNAPQEVLNLVHETSSNLRYGQYEKTLQSLDKLINSPGLTDSQKKIVNDVIEQMKQVITKAGPVRQ